MFGRFGQRLCVHEFARLPFRPYPRALVKLLGCLQEMDAHMYSAALSHRRPSVATSGDGARHSAQAESSS